MNNLLHMYIYINNLLNFIHKLNLRGMRNDESDKKP